MPRKPIWLDCDPGHDDAVAVLLACHLPDVDLLGLSTVHGNAGAALTQVNGARLLEFYAASREIDVWPGANHPLIRPTRADPEIHGVDGLGGAEGLPDDSHDGVKARLKRSSGLKAIHGIAKAVKDLQEEGLGRKLTLIATGPLTNIALFFSIYPELICEITEFVFMGGGVGIGNRSAVAEFNILCDPEAAQIALNAPLRKIMIPLNVTHQALLTPERHARLLNPQVDWVEGSLPDASSSLRHTLSSLFAFFAESYRTTFGFIDGPPLHDALTIAYATKPELFKCTRYRVDVELGVSHAMGETIVDLYKYRNCDETWGATGKNCLVAESAEIPAIFDLMFEAVDLCDRQRAEIL